ncbi:MAG TPA: SusC/RagA family TonB-linked outer membrane protein [Gemmatimonadaceae bacterium]|nr:SusC/RagA family TonB-linked outer membrane protein [Gemmatimonadaceae bacterium]
MRPPIAYVVLALSLGLATSVLPGQQPEPLQIAQNNTSGRGPAFYVVRTPGGKREVAYGEVALRRRLSLALDHVSLADALAAVSQQTGIRFVYMKDEVHVDRLVSLRAQDIALAAALTEILFDAGVDVELLPDNQVALVKRLVKPNVDDARGKEDGNTVRGRVTDAATGVGLADVSVVVNDLAPDSESIARSKKPLRFHVRSSGSTVTGKDGRYQIGGITPGTYVVVAHRLSYAPKVDTITVRKDSGVVTVNFQLRPVAYSLNEVVTTATGQEERYKVGTDIAVIDADSVVKNAPILNVSDLLAARAPGVSVEASSGAVGSPSLIRIRGISSIYGTNDPILIVDGVRVNGSMSAIEVSNMASGGPTPSRLDDIDPNSIEKIEVLKGPSASALYGTDAANGVIVITTKRGTSGPARWAADYTHSWTSVPGNWPWLYQGYGTNPLSNVPGGCSNGSGCHQDSVVRYNPLNNPYTTTLASGLTDAYNLSVSGGAPTVQYYVNASREDQLGASKLSDYDAYLIRKANGGSIDSWVLRPNTNNNNRISSHLTMQPTPTLDLTFTSNFVQQLTLNGGDGINAALNGFTQIDTAYHPSSVLTQRNTSAIDRAFGALSGTWRPTGWLVFHASGGYDYTSRVDQSQSAATDCVTGCPGVTNGLGIGRSTETVTSVDVGGTATWPLHGAIGAKTSLGEQYTKSQTDAVGLAGSNLPQGSTTLNGAASTTASQADVVAATAGWYVQQEFSLNDRLYLSGGVREDAGSGFGSKLVAPAYPKASISWLLSQEPFWPVNTNVLSTVRLRAAYGQSGTQPGQFEAQQVYASQQAVLGGQLVPAYYMTGVGNPYLKPERTGEIEGGADIGVFHDRALIAVTFYQRRTSNELISAALAPSVGGGSYQENVGDVLNQGLEITLQRLLLVDTRNFGWDVNGGVAFNKNDLVSLGNHVLAGYNGTNSTTRFVPGYPLDGVWARPLLGYSDQNHDGIIERSEIVVGDSAVYVGATQPKYELNLSTNIAVLHEFHINMLFSYQHALTQSQGVFNCVNGPQSFGAQSEHASLAQQAQFQYYNVTFSCLPEVVSFLRFQSAALSWDVPGSVTRRLHLRSAQLMLMGRNLGLWTSYAGKDPEVNSNQGRDQISDNGIVPQTRDYSFRVIIGF